MHCWRAGATPRNGSLPKQLPVVIMQDRDAGAASPAQSVPKPDSGAACADTPAPPAATRQITRPPEPQLEAAPTEQPGGLRQETYSSSWKRRSCTRQQRQEGLHHAAATARVTGGAAPCSSNSSCDKRGCTMQLPEAPGAPRQAPATSMSQCTKQPHSWIHSGYDQPPKAS